MKQMQLPFKGMAEVLADKLRAEQYNLVGRYMYTRPQLIVDIKMKGLDGWHVNEGTVNNNYSNNFGLILHEGKNVCGCGGFI